MDKNGGKSDKIVVIGGGMAGFVALNLLEKKLGADRLVLIEPRDYLETPIAVVRGLMDPDGFGKTIRKPWSDLTSVTRISAKAVKIVGDEVILDNGDKVAFGQAIVATGATTKGFPFLKGGTATTLAAREIEFAAEGAKIRAAKSVLLIGGGPVGVEWAGDLASHYPDKVITLVTGSDRLLTALPASAGAKALRVLKSLGVKVILGQSVAADKLTVEAELVYWTTGFQTTAIPVDSPSSRNTVDQLKVDGALRVVGRSNVYAVGDANDVAEIKLAAHGRTQGLMVAANLVALSKNSHAKLQSYTAAPALGVITLGKKAGIAQLPLGRFDFLAGMKQKDLFVSMMLKR